jgi:hypothetical protein
MIIRLLSAFVGILALAAAVAPATAQEVDPTKVIYILTSVSYLPTDPPTAFVDARTLDCTWDGAGSQSTMNFQDYAVIMPGNHGWEFCKYRH